MSSTFNQTSSYNRTYERKVVEEGTGGGGLSGGLGTGLSVGAPTVQFMTTAAPSPLHTIRSTLDPTGAFGTASFAPYNYKFGTSTSGSFHSSDDNFNVTMDVSEFGPEDLKVSVIGSQIIIEGKHAEKQDSLGSIERHFVRKFNLPRNCAPDTVTSAVTPEGQLTVKATAPVTKDTSPGRSIPIKVVHAQASPSGASSSQQQQNGVHN